MVGSLSLQLGMILWGPLSDIVSLDWLLVGSGVCILLMGVAIFFDKTLLRAGLMINDNKKQGDRLNDLSSD